MNNILEAVQLTKSYNNQTILKEIDLQINQGEFLAIMGPSGSGKSTLLYNISGMDQPDSGQVKFRDENLTILNDQEMSRIRLKNMGFIFQHSYLLKNLSIRDNISLPGLKAGILSVEEVNEHTDNLLNMTGISQVGENDIKQVSGGQLQRAAICRALINQPTLLFGDEPTGSLNQQATTEIMDIFNQINENGTTVVIVTHDPNVAARASRIVYLVDGQIHAELNLGNYHSAEVQRVNREKQIYDWLENLGF